MFDLLDWASEQPLFTLNEAERALGMERASLRQKLSRMTKGGELNRIERGKYSMYSDPMIYASYLENPAYITLWSALRFYDLTTQQPSTVQVMSAVARDNLEEAEFYQSSNMYGFGRRRYGDFEIFVADEERLLLDCLSRAPVTVTDLTELIEVIDPDRAAEYAKRLGQYATMKRVGYLMEHVRGIALDQLRVEDRNYPRLDPSRPDSGRTDTKWRLRVNTDVTSI